MAIQQNNSVMYGTKGLFNKQVVFKSRYGKPYVAGPPRIKADQKATPQQEQQREKFKRCVIYAKTVKNDPGLKSLYQQAVRQGQTPYNVAFLDAYYGPEILDVHTGLYEGRIGDLMTIQVVDNFKVKAVRVSLFTATGELLEEGEAALQIDGLNWEYAAKETNNNRAGTKMVVDALDLPGNGVSLETVL